MNSCVSFFMKGRALPLNMGKMIQCQMVIDISLCRIDGTLVGAWLIGVKCSMFYLHSGGANISTSPATCGKHLKGGAVPLGSWTGSVTGATKIMKGDRRASLSTTFEEPTSQNSNEPGRIGHGRAVSRYRSEISNDLLDELISELQRF